MDSGFRRNDVAILLIQVDLVLGLNEAPVFPDHLLEVIG